MQYEYDIDETSDLEYHTLTDTYCFGIPLANVYPDLETIETDDYILSKKSYRYPKDTVTMLTGGLVPGDYIVLYSKKRNCVVMSDTPMERYTNQSIMRNAKGDICMLGLGIGMTIFGMIEEYDQRDYYEESATPIKSITIIEKDKALIDIIEPLIRNSKKFKESGITLEIINDDAYVYPSHCARHFDIVYADIWDEYPGFEENAYVFDELEQLYSPFCDSFDGWGYADAHGENPDDDSPIESDDYMDWLSWMINAYCDYDYISTEMQQNACSYLNRITD